MKKKFIVLIAIAAVVVAGALFAWRFLGSSDDANAVYVQAVSDLNMVQRGIANRFAGVVESQESKHVDPDGGKKVAQLLVAEGESVIEGQPLFRYDTDAIRIEIQQVELDIEKALDDIAFIKQEIQDLELYPDTDTPTGQFNAATVREKKVELAQAEYDLKQKQNELTRLQNSLKEDTVTAPIAGTVQTINESVSEEGGYDNQGNPLHYIVITASGELRVKGTVSEQYIMSLSEGLPVLLRSRVNESVWDGTIDRIDTSQPEQENNYYYSPDRGNGASKYSFYVTLDSVDGLLMGQHLTIEPNYGQSNAMTDGIWLSAGWFTSTDDAAVWKQGVGARLVRQAVELGEYNADYDCYQVVGGLDENDCIAWPSADCVNGVKTTTTYVEPSMEDMPMEDMPMDEFPMDEFPMDDMTDSEYAAEDEHAVALPEPAMAEVAMPVARG